MLCVPYKELQKQGKAHCNERLSSHTTFNVGGRTDLWIEPFNIECLSKIIDYSFLKHIPFKIIGSGSNVLCPDLRYKGIVISLKKEAFCSFNINNKTVRAGAGLLLSRFIQMCQKNSLSGLEKLYGIPGTIGGAITGNSGAFGSSISDCLLDVDILKDGRVKPTQRFQFFYRNSSLKNTIIISARFKMKSSKPQVIRQIMMDIHKKRIDTQPIGEKSAGCIFKNTDGKSAGALLSLAGMKGVSIGGAAYSEKHANFIINKKNACAKDIIKLIELGKKTVKEKFNIKLQTEINIWGE